MRSDKLFSILVIAGGALAASLAACSSSDPGTDGGVKTDSGNNPDGGQPQDTGVFKDTGGAQDTGVGAEFW
jgi:hypothetical protein